MILIYSILLRLYTFLIFIVSPFNKKAKTWLNGRKNWEKKLQEYCFSVEDKIWVHCSSFGEYEDFVAVLKKFKIQYPNIKVVLSFYSPSGYEHINDPSAFDFKFYLPQDSSRNAYKLIDIIQPKFALFSRSELWYFYLMELNKRQISSYLIGLNLDDKNGFLKPMSKPFFKKCFHLFSKIYALNHRTELLIKEHFDYNKVLVSGNARIDRIYQKAIDKQEFPDIENFINGQFCVIGGSATTKDEEHLFHCIEKFKHLPIKWIICPHDIHEDVMNERISFNPMERTRYKDLKPEDSINKRVLYIDFVGGLKSIYQYTNYALIGGGFIPKGIHNIIEPAIYGNPVTFGPNHRDYVEALEMIGNGYAVIHHNKEELDALIEKAFYNKHKEVVSDKIKAYVQSKIGADDKILKDLSLLEDLRK